MRAASRLRPAGIGAAVLALAVALLVTGGAQADDPAALRGQAERLAGVDRDLADREHGAVLELYALRSRLGAAERRVAAIRARISRVERERATTRRLLAVARRAHTEADRQLGARLRALYVEGNVDPVAVVLGAESFTDAITALDNLARVAGQDRQIIEQVEKARKRLRASTESLAAREAQLRALATEADSARASLAAATSERIAYIEQLRRVRNLNQAELARLSAAAAAAETRAEELVGAAPEAIAVAAPGAASLAAFEPAAPVAGGQVSVFATGYALPGTTATGIPVGWGVVAVDPSFIPLGTRMSIPGYGEGIAADTGSAVVGARIDLWFPTVEEALAWGTRTVTVTLR